MFTLFITATNTDIGKSFASSLIIDRLALLKPQLKIGVCKPIETGVGQEPLDASLLLNSCKDYNDSFLSLTPQDITAYTFSLPASPFVASKKEQTQISIPKIHKKIKELQTLCDILIVEGAGGLLVPITKDYFMVDLIRDTADKTLLITSSKLGSINDTMLSIEALKRREIDFDWCVNLYEEREHFSSVTKPFYDEYFRDYWFLESGVDRFLESLIDEINLLTSIIENKKINKI